MRILFFLFGCVLAGHAQSLDVKRVMPLGVARGKEVVVTFTGTKVETATGLWTSFGAGTRKVGSEKEGEVKFAVVCPESAEPGIEAMQLSGPAGVSGWVLVIVDDFGAEQGNGENRKRVAARVIKPPVAVDSRTAEDSADYYQFGAEEGETYSMEVVAHRIGSSMDPSVVIMNESGREFFFSDDADGGKDARFRFRAPKQGTYFLQVRDIGFAGGDNYFYRLRVGDFPLVSFTLPRMNGGHEFVGPHAEMAQLKGKHNGLMTPHWREEAFVADRESADSEAPLVELPTVIYGRFDNPGDHDHFRFAAREGDRLVFASRTRSFGSACDAMLKIVTAEGELVAEANPGGAGEIALTNKFTRGGEFILQVQELSGGGGPSMGYRIEVAKFAPGFTLACEAPFVEVTSGGTAKVKVTCTRYEYEGPIELALDGAGEGIGVDNNVIPEKKNEIELKLVLSDEWEPGQSVRFGIEGQGRGTPAARVSTKAALRKAWPLMLHPPAELDGLLTLGVK